MALRTTARTTTRTTGRAGPPSPDKSCAIDRAHLARYTLGDPQLELEVLGLFAGQALQSLEALAHSPDDKAWREAAHTIKGSARAVGAWTVADCAATAESLGPSRDPLACSAVLARLRAALAEACCYIDGLKIPGPADVRAETATLVRVPSA